MDSVFLTVLNMSLTGAFVIAAVCIARLPLQKAPKIISYCLWIVVAFRLVCPFSIESAVSLVPFNAETIPPALVAEHINSIDSSIPAIDGPINDFIGQMHQENRGDAYGNWWTIYPLQELVYLGAWVWMIGVVAMAVYGVVSFFILKGKMRESTYIEGNIYEAGMIESPFVLGVFYPRIYLPIGLSEKERGYVVLHEQTHIKRYDHMIKFAAYFILCLHWFNPLVWAAFHLMGVDMEMSCDERVLRKMGSETKKDYSLSLLSLATQRRFVGGSPLAFGEGGVKERIKRVLHFKQPSRVISVAAIALAAILIVGFAVNRVNLIEFEVIYSDVDEYGFAMQFKLGDIVYSPYFIDDFLGGTRGLKEIGYAVGDFSGTVREGTRDKYRVFEREGYSIDEYIIVKDDGFMNPARIFAAVQSGVPESPVAEQETGNAYAPTIIIQSASPAGITYLFENRTGNKYTYGEAFALYVRENNGWRPVKPIIENWGFDDIGYDIEPSSQTDLITIDWQWLFGQLPPGDYQIHKEVLYIRTPGDYDKYIIDGYFTIQPDNEENQQAASYEPWMSSWRPLSDLSAEYNLFEARTSNTIVVIDADGIYNQHMVDIFYREVAYGSAAMMRVVQSTIEGDAIITDYQYDGDAFIVTHDNTRDVYAAQEDRIITTRVYKYLVQSNRQQSASIPSTASDAPAVFYLSNEESIFTTNLEGRIMLIDDLWWIPPPSDTAG